MVYKELIWKQFVALRSPLRKLNFWSTPPLWRRYMFIYPINLSALCLIKNFTRNIEEIRRRFLEKLTFSPFYETIFHSHFHIYPLLQFWKKINIKAAMYSSNKKRWFFVKGTLYVPCTPPEKDLQSGHPLLLPPKGHLKFTVTLESKKIKSFSEKQKGAWSIRRRCRRLNWYFFRLRYCCNKQ